MNNSDQLKAVIRHFNTSIIQNGDFSQFDNLVADDFLNHTAPPGIPNTAAGYRGFFTNILHKGLSDIEVIIHYQLCEGDKVATHKTIHGTHTGEFLGQAPTGARLAIRVMDIVRVKDGKYTEHWGTADLFGALAQIRMQTKQES